MCNDQLELLKYTCDDFNFVEANMDSSNAKLMRTDADIFSYRSHLVSAVLAACTENSCTRVENHPDMCRPLGVR